MNTVLFSLPWQHQDQGLSIRSLGLNLVLAPRFTCSVVLTTPSTALSFVMLQALGWMTSLRSHLTLMVLSPVTLNYCHLLVAGTASGCSSILWTGDILGLPSTCPSNKARQPCRLAKPKQIILTGREVLLCKRKNFNFKVMNHRTYPRIPEAVDPRCC